MVEIKPDLLFGQCRPLAGSALWFAQAKSVFGRIWHKSTLVSTESWGGVTKPRVDCATAVVSDHTRKHYDETLHYGEEMCQMKSGGSGDSRLLLPHIASVTHDPLDHEPRSNISPAPD